MTDEMGKMAYEIKWSGDRMLSICFEEKIDESINFQVNALKFKLIQLNLHGIDAITSTYHTVSVYYDGLEIDREELVEIIKKSFDPQLKMFDSEKNIVFIPVLYDGEDIERVALHCGISVEEVIKRHSSVNYRIYMLGFSPGFPYLGGMDQTIATPRLQTPRLKIEAGSIGIADQQTGIYPVESPGGWNLIGRTPLKLFDPSNSSPFLLRSGQIVRFVPLGKDEYKRIMETGGRQYACRN